MVVISTSNTDIYRLDAGYYVHIYSTPGTRSIEITEGGNVDVLVVAGGGSGGLATTAFAAGGGGGGGEVAYVTSFPVTVGTMSITVGAGGSNSNGGNSIFGSIQANGGGKGGSPGATANTGGSGGGAGRNVLTSAASVKLYASGLGNAGGIGISTISGAAGGGGAGGVGGNVLNGTNGGVGGAGYTTSISGVLSQVYGSGGGGGARGGGDTGGGNGGTNAGKGGGCETTSLTAINGGNAINGFGGGGGGAGGGGNAANTNIGIPGTGGSGIIIVRYPRPPLQSTGVMSLSDLRSAYAFENPSSGEFSLGTLYGWTNVPNTSALTGVMNLSDYYGKTGGVGLLFNETGLTTTYAQTTMPGGIGTTHTISSVYNYQVSGLAGWSVVRYRSNGTQLQIQNYGNLRTNANLSTKMAKVLSYLQAIGRTVTLTISYAVIKGTIYSATNNNKTLRILVVVNGVSNLVFETVGSQATITRSFNITSYLAGATSFAINLHFNIYADDTGNVLDSNRLEINSLSINVY